VRYLTLLLLDQPFSTRFNLYSCDTYEDITKHIGGPLVENPWPKLCIERQVSDPACDICTELHNGDLNFSYPALTSRVKCAQD
jgi:hypothetical protein